MPDLTLHHPNTASGNIAESEKGVKNMSKQSHRTCVRMSVKDYELLKEKSAAAGLSANAWLMAQMKTNRLSFTGRKKPGMLSASWMKLAVKSMLSPAISTAAMAQRNSFATLSAFWEMCTSGFTQ